MSFNPLKKILLASALTLAAAFNLTSCRTSRDAVDARVYSPTASLPPDSIAKKFNARGDLVKLERYRSGKLQDGVNGEPAYQQLNDEGKVIVVERYFDGMLNDGPNGEPSVENFNDVGNLTHLEFNKSDVLDDGLRGEPALQDFNDNGNLILAIRYRNGEMTKILTTDECAIYQSQVHPERKKAPPLLFKFKKF